jgi:tripartite-type tricarboxylate transporter receptor subunit TctC
MKLFVFTAVVFAALAIAPPSHAQGDAAKYPNRPVRVIVPFAPGGVTDVMGRLLAQKLSDNLGKQFYIDNVGGAGGNIGTGMATREPADGYTLVVTSSSYVVNPSLHARVPYDPNKDLIPVTISGASPNVVVVNPQSPVKTVKDLVEMVKNNPGKHNFASPGVGTTPHLSGELFRLSLGLDMVHVPFTGAGPALQSIIGGHTDMAFTGLPSAVSAVTSGTLRALAVTSGKRSSGMPEVPVMAEAGYSGQEAETLLFVLVHAGTPKDIVNFLYQEIARIVAQPETQKEFERLGFAPVASNPEDSFARVKQELATWAKVIRDANLQQK